MKREIRKELTKILIQVYNDSNAFSQKYSVDQALIAIEELYQLKKGRRR